MTKPKRTQRNCWVCGVDISHRDAHARLCSIECERQRWKQIKDPTYESTRRVRSPDYQRIRYAAKKVAHILADKRRCVECGASIAGKTQKARFCGKKCSGRAYVRTNPEYFAAYRAEYYLRDPIKRQGYTKKWMAKHPGYVAFATCRYRTRKDRAQPRWLTEADHRKMAGTYKQSAEASAKTGVVHNVDHIVPLGGKNVCGLHVPWNLRVVPMRVNVRKHNKHIDPPQQLKLGLAA